MNTQDSLYFPGTVIYSDSQYPIFLLFARIHILEPVEAAENDGAAAEPADLFINNGFCQAHTPCPLGDSRGRFLHLIADIKNRRDDYAAQLSSLTMAAMSAPRPQEDDTTQTIISSLLGTQAGKGEQEKEDAIRHALWQARLVLKIAEILDQEEEDIARQFSQLDDRETDLFRHLHGEEAADPEEEEDPLRELLEMRDKTSQPSSAVIKNRFRAWKQLYVAGELPEWPIWTTHMAAAADIILDLYESAQGRPAPEIGRFALPAGVGQDRQEAIEHIASFRAGNMDLLSRMAADLAAVLADKPDETAAEERFPAVGSAVCREWNETLDNHFPAGQFGRTTVTAYLLPDRSFSSLLGKKTADGTAERALLLVIA
jgi:hypothetical protein